MMVPETNQQKKTNPRAGAQQIQTESEVRKSVLDSLGTKFFKFAFLIWIGMAVVLTVAYVILVRKYAPPEAQGEAQGVALIGNILALLFMLFLVGAPITWIAWKVVVKVQAPRRVRVAMQRAQQHADEARAATERQVAKEVAELRQRQVESARRRAEQQAVEARAADEQRAAHEAVLERQREDEARRAATRQEEARRAELEALATRIKGLRKRRDDLVRKYSTLLVREIDAALAKLPQSGATDAARPLADAAEQIFNTMDDRLQRRSELQRRSAEIQKEHRGLSARLGKGELGQASFDRAYQALEQEKGDIDNDMDQLEAQLFEDKSEKPV